MKTISQVAKLTGVSIRTLQYYDEIGLLKPSELTPAGYRLYDEHALQTLQQILFFRELDFPLKDIIKIEQNRCAMACQGCGAVFTLKYKKQW